MLDLQLFNRCHISHSTGSLSHHYSCAWCFNQRSCSFAGSPFSYFRRSTVIISFVIHGYLVSTLQLVKTYNADLVLLSAIISYFIVWSWCRNERICQGWSVKRFGRCNGLYTALYINPILRFFYLFIQLTIIIMSVIMQCRNHVQFIK